MSASRSAHSLPDPYSQFLFLQIFLQIQQTTQRICTSQQISDVRNIPYRWGYPTRLLVTKKKKKNTADANTQSAPEMRYHQHFKTMVTFHPGQHLICGFVPNLRQEAYHLPPTISYTGTANATHIVDPHPEILVCKAHCLFWLLNLWLGVGLVCFLSCMVKCLHQLVAGTFVHCWEPRSLLLVVNTLPYMYQRWCLKLLLLL